MSAVVTKPKARLAASAAFAVADGHANNASPALSDASVHSRNANDNISVFVRMRPVKDEDLSSYGYELTEYTIADAEIKADPYVFSGVFPPATRNDEVYETVARPIVGAVLEGYNGTVFAYGQTGSGKTHTMVGVPHEPGILPRAIQQVFDYVDSHQDSTFLLRVAFYEVYNEEIHDLVNNNKNKKELVIREIDDAFHVTGLQEQVVTKPEDVEEVLRIGNIHRSMGISNFNEHSSRSHAIFRLVIESASTIGKSAAGKKLHGPVRLSELNLVDLAGSETVSYGYGQAQQKETKAINLSLTQLKTVTVALNNQEGHIPYRNSALTKILRNSLGGNARTAIICTCSPLDEHSKMTRNTLAFGALAKEVKNKPKCNEVYDSKNKDLWLRQLQKKIEEQERKLGKYFHLEGQKRKMLQEHDKLRVQIANLEKREKETQQLIDELRNLQRDARTPVNIQLQMKVVAAPAPPTNHIGVMTDPMPEPEPDRSEEMTALTEAMQTLVDEKLKLQEQIVAQQEEKEKYEQAVAAKLAEVEAARDRVAAEKEKLKQAEEEKEELERIETIHRETIRKIHREIADNSLDRDAYLARMIDNYERERARLVRVHEELLGKKEAEKLELIQQLKRFEEAYNEARTRVEHAMVREKFLSSRLEQVTTRLSHFEATAQPSSSSSSSSSNSSMPTAAAELDEKGQPVKAIQTPLVPEGSIERRNVQVSGDGASREGSEKDRQIKRLEKEVIELRLRLQQMEELDRVRKMNEDIAINSQKQQEALKADQAKSSKGLFGRMFKGSKAPTAAAAAPRSNEGS